MTNESPRTLSMPFLMLHPISYSTPSLPAGFPVRLSVARSSQLISARGYTFLFQKEVHGSPLSVGCKEFNTKLMYLLFSTLNNADKLQALIVPTREPFKTCLVITFPMLLAANIISGSMPGGTWVLSHESS